MATDYKADIQKYTTTVNEAAVTTIVKYCGIALQSKDSSLVSVSDAEELKRVQVGFATKKLGLTDAQWATGSAKVNEQMKAERNKSRVTYYYLLAEATDTMGKLG
jgi:Protein of unknown function (DUF2853)